MIPSRRVYQLLLLGTAIGLFIATIGSDVVNPQFLGVSILLTLGFDAAVLLLAVMDARRVKAGRAVVEREHSDRLSIGRDNPVQLTMKTGYQPAVLQIRDFLSTRHSQPAASL